MLSGHCNGSKELSNVSSHFSSVEGKVKCDIFRYPSDRELYSWIVRIVENFDQSGD